MATAKFRHRPRRDERVVGLGAIHTMHVGPHESIVMLSVEFRSDLGADGIAEAVQQLHERVEGALAHNVEARLIAIEPAPRAPRPMARVS